MEKRKLEYIDAMPGAGKTAYFVDAAVALLNDPQPDRIILYVAPTVNLLVEALKRIRGHTDFMPCEDQVEDRILLVVSYERIGVKDVTYAQATVVNNKPVKLLNYYLGLLPLDQLPADGDTPLRIARRGNILLTTHESFLQVLTKDLTKQNFKTLKQTHVIFDEARQCVIAENTMPGVRDSDFPKIATTFSLARVAPRWISPEKIKRAVVNNKVIDSKSPGWYVYQIVASKSVTYLKSVFAPDKVPAAILRMHHTVVKYTLSGRASVYLLAHVEVDTIMDAAGANHTASVYAILRPTSMFDKYGKITLTSAFFKDSQMYHFLKQDGHTFVDLMQTSKSAAITKIKIADNNLRKSLPERLRVGVLLEANRDAFTRKLYREVLTSGLLKSGMVVPKKITTLVIEKYINRKLTSKEVAKRLVLGRTVSADINFQTLLKKYAVPPLWVLLNEACYILKQYWQEAGLQGKPIAMLTINKPKSQMWNPSGSKYLKAVEAFYSKGRICTDVSDGYESLVSEEDLLLAKTIPAEWHVKLKELLFYKSGYFALTKSPKLQGINKYRELKAFVHLAALNPSPPLIHMYKTLLGETYDIDQDHVIENLVQTLYRTNLRVVGPKDPVLMVVPYKSNALLLQTKIGCNPFNFINEPRLATWSYKKEVEEAKRIEVAKKASAVAAAIRTIYKQDPESKRKLAVLRVKLSRANAKLDTTGSDYDLALVEDLKSQMDQLKLKPS